MPRKIVKSKYIIEGEAVESLAEVPENEVKPWGPDAELKVVGKPTPRVDGHEKVSGGATYTCDVILPRMTHAKILRCPLPHARIKYIDTRKAERLPGVLAVITAENTPQIPWYYGMTYLFDKHVRYEGDEVACVAAETAAIAEEALKLISVDYAELAFVVDAGEAMMKQAPKLYDTGNVFRGRPVSSQRGDIEKALVEASAIVEGVYSTQCEVHNTMEAHGSVVKWDGDRLTVWDSTQAVFSVRDAVAQSLEIPASKVRVIKKYMGGGFGSKLEAGKYTVMAALLARKIGRPVKITLDRKEVNLAVGNRPDSVQRLKAAATKDGILTALEHRSHGAGGAHYSGAACSAPLQTLYKCANVKTEEYTVAINAGRGRPFRAPGHVQGTFALESVLDELAEKIGMDPLDFRKKNHVEVDQTSNKPYTSKRLLECYDQGAKAIGWYERRKPPGSGTGPVKRGLGLASQIWWGGGGPPAYATIKLNRDGSARVITGTQDIGGGTYTFVAQVAAEVLQIPIEKIQVTLGDTGVCPYAPLSGGSLTAPSVSPAVRDAAENMKAKLLSGAAAAMEVPEDELQYLNGVITHKKADSSSMSITDIIGKMREQVLVATGARSANPQEYAINSFGVQFAEVEVDTETGKVRVKKVVAAHDVGRILNPKTADNQFHGGIMQGLSFALLEERAMDAYTGKVLTTNLFTYKLPTIMDTPEIEVIIVSDSDPLISNTGVKGIGEPAMIPTPGAIANAVYNAIGVRIRELPITPDKVLNALYG